MKKMKKKMTFWVLFTLLFFIGQSSEISFNEKISEIEIPKIEVKISKTNNILEGQPVIVKCEITNKSKYRQKIEFTETHGADTKLPYATCITAKIFDSNDSSLCKYMTQYFVWSTLFLDRDKKYITLKPKEKITRDLIVSDVAIKCSCEYKNGFKKGKYKIQVYVHSVFSNILEMEIN